MKYDDYQKENRTLTTATNDTVDDFSTTTTTEKKLEFDVDYGKVDENYISELKRQIVKDIMSLINFDILKENSIIFNKETNEENTFLSKLLIKNINSKRILEQFVVNISNSLFTNSTAIRFFGNFFNPKLYISTSFVYTQDAMEKLNFQYVMSQYKINRGITPLYFFETLNIEFDYVSYFSGSIEKENKKVREIERKKDEIKLPVILFEPFVNNDNEAITLFGIIQYQLKRQGIFNNTLDAYLKYYNYHLLPNEKLIGKDSKGMENLFKKVIISVQNKTLGQSGEEYFNQIDPDMSNLKEVLEVNKILENDTRKKLGLWIEEIEGTSQKSEFEIQSLKEKQINLIKDLTNYYNSKWKEMWNMILDLTFGKDVYEINSNLEAKEIVNKKQLGDVLGSIKDSPDMEETQQEIIDKIT